MATHEPYTPSAVLLRKDPLVAGHEEDGLKAFGKLLGAVGTGSFSGQAIDYLRAYLDIEQSIIALFSMDQEARPELLFRDVADDRSCALYLRYIQRHRLPEGLASDPERQTAFVVPAPADPAARSFERDMRDFLGIEAELRIALPIDGNRIAMLLLGKGRWSEAEYALAVRCAEFIRSTILVHINARRAVTPARSREWRLDHIRSSLGDDKLTSREFDVAVMMLAGESTHAIAKKLAISVATVKVHRRHIYAKLKISGQAELFALTFRGASL